MKKATKVFTSLILVGSMCMSLTSCFGASKAVKEAATEFMEAALERDIDDMADLCTDDDEAYMYLGAYVTEFDPVDALLERAEFSIGKITVKKDKATAEVTVTFPDYEAALDGDPEDVDEFEALLDDQKKTVDITFELDLKEKKDEWLVDSPEDFAEDFYGELYDIDFGFCSEYEGWVDHHNWYGSDNDVYSSSRSSLNLEIYMSDEHYSETVNFYFSVLHDGSVIYNSGNRTDSGFIDNYCYQSDVGVNNWESGSYTFVFYDSNDVEFYRATCSVN